MPPKAKLSPEVEEPGVPGRVEVFAAEPKPPVLPNAPLLPPNAGAAGAPKAGVEATGAEKAKPPPCGLKPPVWLLLFDIDTSSIDC